jgi:hypothetical protein
MQNQAAFALSIEPVHGATYQHGFHLGTIESMARQIAVERFNNLSTNVSPIRTVALLRGGDVLDVYDGRSWTSELQGEADYERATTLAELRVLLRKARAVYCQPRFGGAQRWVRITKAEARHVIGTAELDMSDFPCGRAGEIDGDGNLFLG